MKKTELITDAKISLTTNVNSPYIHFCKVVEETPKAVRLESEYKTHKVWIPKKALVHTKESDTYTFAMWFRQLDNGKAINTAFKLFQ